MIRCLVLVCLSLIPAIGLCQEDSSRNITRGRRQRWSGLVAGELRELNKELKLTMAWCPPGRFTMGSPAGEKDRYDDDEDQVSVTLTKGYWLGRTEVTQGQWKSVMGTTPWDGKDYVKEGSDYPATYVSWDDAVAFCAALTKREREAGHLPAGYSYRLPTEAEWEYACRAGTTTAYSFGADGRELSRYGWWGGLGGDGNAKEEKYAHRVGLKLANGWKLHDMHGNVWEWCRDGYQEKLPGGGDPLAIELSPEGSLRVIRGGGWSRLARYCRSARRNGTTPSRRYSALGFRLALSPSAQ